MTPAPVLPPEAPDAAGRRLAAVSQANYWGDLATRLLHERHTAYISLGFVVLYLALRSAVQLIDGNRGRFNGDPEARTDCPVPLRELRKSHDRLRRIRNAVLHLTENDEWAGWRIHLGESEVAIFARQRPDGPEVVEFTLAEADRLLADLLPWLRTHFDRLTSTSVR